MIIFDSDDFGCNHEISGMCQSHDCRDVLLEFKKANPYFKATLFAIPGEMTYELLEWSKANNSWIELAVHGFYHSDNYECEKMSYKTFDDNIRSFQPILDEYFVKGFKAPGWQISHDVYQWMIERGWWVADQAYNDERRPKKLRSYKLDDRGLHTHTWNCVGNGVYELFDHIIERIKHETEFRFVSEVIV